MTQSVGKSEELRMLQFLFGGSMRRISVALIGLTLVPMLRAEHHLRLDVPVGGEFLITNPRLLGPCDLGLIVAQIGQTLRVPVGFENARDCWLTPRVKPGPIDTVDLRGMSPRQAFDHLMTFMPAFSWREMDGVIVVRPSVAWGDPRNVLNLPTRAFEATDQRLDDMLHTLLDAVTPNVSVPHDDVPKPERPIDRRVTVVFGGGTMMEALNAVARARTDVDWQFGYCVGPCASSIQFGTFDFHGGIIGAPVAVPQAAP